LAYNIIRGNLAQAAIMHNKIPRQLSFRSAVQLVCQAAKQFDSEAYLLTCMRYIELNPVRAGMVIDPADYPWSSYHHNALGQLSVLVVPHPEYLRLGESNEVRQAAYRELFKQHLSENSISEIREATNKAWVLGNDRFKQRIQDQLGRRVESKARGGYRKSEQFKSNRDFSLGRSTSS
jgi:putative transposase